MRRLLFPSALLAISAAPLLMIIVSARGSIRVDGRSLANTVLFACGAAAVAVLLGSFEAIALGMTNLRGRAAANVICVIPLAAPAAFWWLGLQRLGPIAAVAVRGLAGAIAISGIALSPIP